MNWDLTVKIFLIMAGCLEVLCLLFCGITKHRNKKLPKEERRSASLPGQLCFWLAWLVCIGLFSINYYLAKAPPFGNMFQVMSFMPIILAPLYLYVSHLQKRPWLLGYFAAASLIALAGAFSMPFQSTWSQMPALQSPWFVPHVAAYVLSYALATVGTLLAIVSYFKGSESRKYTEAAYGMILLAFPFMSFGLWSGAIWADEVWGGYWSWDIKEVWSLITWGLYLVYFHMRRIPGWCDYQRIVIFVAFTALLVTFLVVNLMPKISSMHSYAM